MEGEQPSSVVCITASEVFPKKPLKTDDLSSHILFPELEGEGTEYLGSTSDATLALSNFRLFISFKDSFLNLPIRLIESVELRDLNILQVNCKDARSFKIFFDNNEQCLKWLHRLSVAVVPPRSITDLFSFTYHAWTLDYKTINGSGNGDCNGLCLTDGPSPYSLFNEMQRLGFETNQENSPWRITDINSKFEICPTYPKLHIVPKSITDDELENVALFRCARRFPSVVWRHLANGAVIARCSQPAVGWLGWRNTEDEKFLQAIGSAGVENTPTNTLSANEPENSIDKEDLPNGEVTNGEISASTRTGERVLIVDARSYTAAVANRAKGGGCECTEYYPNCEMEFMNLGNIHVIRKSFQSLRNLCSGPKDVSGWWSQLEKTNWLQHISMLFKAAITVVNTIDKHGKSVLVHCSDGWDRTTQIVALAELLLDPYYRTIEGFKVLVDREWIEFGHRFADRCGHGSDDDDNQRCPVFIQWLDCVHQLLRHFPCAFEFNETFLCKLVQHTYSCLFGTFLCNNESERQRENVKTKTFSVWSLFHPRRKEFRNLLYSPNSYRVLVPSCHVQSLVLWSAVYLAYSTPFAENRDNELHADSPNTPSSSSSSSLRFPSNFSDSNIETKPPPTTGIISSKSDGDLVRNHTCKTCNDRQLDHLGNNSTQCLNDASHYKNGSSVDALNGDADHPNEEDNLESKSLYVSATTGKSKTNVESCSDENIISDMNSSMSSSGGTVVPEEAHETDSEGEGKGEANTLLSDTNSCAGTQNSCDISQSKQDSSSYEHLSSLSELGNTSENNENELENSEDLDKSESDTVTNNCADDPTCVSTQTLEDQKPNSTRGIQTSESITTIKPSPSDMYARYLDNDGLTLMQNDVQDRLRQIEMAYQEQLEALRGQVLDERRKRIMGIVDSGCRSTDLNDDVCSLPDSTQSGEQPPLSNGSGDESSWIEVEESDAEPTRWVPDHVATNCANCDAEFWMANRKHHCRNCGQVFCGTCSNHNLPVPNEQLYDPVRVCMSCFEKLVCMEGRQKERRRNPEMVSAVG